MGSRLHGITVTLYERAKTGTDGFGRAIYAETPTPIENVIVGLPTSDDITGTLELTGKKVAYMLAIPKGDAHAWTDRRVDFFGESFRVIGAPVQGIEDMIPLAWNKKVKVERIG